MSIWHREKFVKVFCLQGTTAGGSGASYESPLPFVDQDLWTIPQDCIIDKVYAIVDTAVTGTTDIDVGDDDDSDGYLDGSLSLTLGTEGMYGNNAKIAGAYLRVQTAGATDAGDIYVVPSSKYYTVGTKKLKLDCTTANTAGKVRIVVEGTLLKAVS